MDDLKCIYAYYTEEEKQQAYQFFNLLINNCYCDNNTKSELVLEPTSNYLITQPDQFRFEYLDCIISIKNKNIHQQITAHQYLDKYNSTILLSSNMKNDSSIRSSSPHQIIFHYQHFNSYSSIIVKKGVIKSTIIRIYRTTNNSFAFLFNSIQLKKELTYLMYPNYILISLLKILYQQTQIKLYEQTYQIMKVIQKITSKKFENNT